MNGLEIWVVDRGAHQLSAEASIWGHRSSPSPSRGGSRLLLCLGLMAALDLGKRRGVIATEVGVVKFEMLVGG